MEYFTLANNTLYVVDNSELGILGYITELPKSLSLLIKKLGHELNSSHCKALSILYGVLSKVNYDLLNEHYQEILAFYVPEKEIIDEQ